jgi:hypothetical protein
VAETYRAFEQRAFGLKELRRLLQGDKTARSFLTTLSGSRIDRSVSLLRDAALASGRFRDPSILTFNYQFDKFYEEPA